MASISSLLSLANTQYLTTKGQVAQLIGKSPKQQDFAGGLGLIQGSLGGSTVSNDLLVDFINEYVPNNSGLLANLEATTMLSEVPDNLDPFSTYSYDKVLYQYNARQNGTLEESSILSLLS